MMKKTDYKRKLTGVLLLVLSLVLLCLAVWMFTKTLGTALLFTDSRIGRFARYYWLLLLAAVLCLAAGLVLMKWKGKTETAEAGAEPGQTDIGEADGKPAAAAETPKERKKREKQEKKAEARQKKAEKGKKPGLRPTAVSPKETMPAQPDGEETEIAGFADGTEEFTDETEIFEKEAEAVSKGLVPETVPAKETAGIPDVKEDAADGDETEIVGGSAEETRPKQAEVVTLMKPAEKKPAAPAEKAEAEVPADQTKAKPAGIVSFSKAAEKKAGVKPGAAQGKASGSAFCPQCGKPVKKGAAFCVYCGNKL